MHIFHYVVRSLKNGTAKQRVNTAVLNEISLNATLNSSIVSVG